MKFALAVFFASATLLSAVGLVTSGGWLISAATLMPPILTLQVAIVGVRFFGISRGVARYVERVISHDSALTGIAELRQELWNKASDLGPRGIWRLKSSDSLDRLTDDTNTLQDKVTRVQVPFIAAWVSALILVMMATLWLTWAGVLLALIFIIAGFVVPGMNYKVEKQIARSAMTTRNALNEQILKLTKSGSVLQMLGALESEFHLLREQEENRHRIESRAAWWGFITQMLVGLLTGAVVTVTALVAADAYLADALDGKMIAVLVLLPLASAEIINTFNQVVVSYTRVREADARIKQLLLPGSLQEKSHVRFDVKTLNIRNLYVSWDQHPTLKDINFDVHRGESIAIIGESGSGKSTLATALLGLIEYEGSIQFNGTEISTIENTSDYITALTQESYIFTTSIAENLKIAKASSTNAELLEVLSSVGLSYLASSESDLETLIGGPYRQLSGGETQRLGIARILLSDSPFVILDEPTAHLDSDARNQIWDLIKSVMSTKTLIVITHDTELLTDVGKVIYLQNGEIGTLNATK